MSLKSAEMLKCKHDQKFWFNWLGPVSGAAAKLCHIKFPNLKSMSLLFSGHFLSYNFKTQKNTKLRELYHFNITKLMIEKLKNWNFYPPTNIVNRVNFVISISLICYSDLLVVKLHDKINIQHKIWIWCYGAVHALC